MAQAPRKVSTQPSSGLHSFPAKVLQEESNLSRASHPALALMVSSMVNMVQKGGVANRHI